MSAIAAGIRAGIKGAAKSADDITKGILKASDDIAKQLDVLKNQGYSPAVLAEAEQVMKSGKPFTAPPIRNGAPNGHLIMGDDIRMQAPEIVESDIVQSAEKAINREAMHRNPIFPEDGRYREPVAKRYDDSIRADNLKLSNKGRTKAEKEAFRKSWFLAKEGPFAHHHILDLEWTGKVLNRMDSDAIVKELKRFGIEIGDRAKNIIGAMDQKTTDFRLSAQDDIARQLGEVDFKSVKKTPKERLIQDLLKSTDDPKNLQGALEPGERLVKVNEQYDLKIGADNKLPKDASALEEVKYDYAVPTDPQSYGLPRGDAIAGKRFGYKVAKFWPDGRPVTTADLRKAYQNRWKFNNINRKQVKYDPQGMVLSKDHVDTIHYAGYNSPQFTAKRRIEAMVESGEWRTLTPKQAAAEIAQVYEIQKRIVLNVSQKRLSLVKTHLRKSKQGKLIISKGPQAIRDWIIKNPLAANFNWSKTKPPTFKWLTKEPGPITEELQIIFATELEPFLNLDTFAQTFSSQL